MKFPIFVFLLALTSLTIAQEDISNKNRFKKFLKSDGEKSLLIIGENHASAVGSEIYPDLVKYLNSKTGLRTLLIEFGPSEAFFYSQYLKTGDEKHLNYTLYAGSYKGWRRAWREIYKFNQTLEEPLKIKGIDFDRTRTLAYALFSIFMKYDKRPDFIQELMNEIKTDKFYKTYTIGYPTELDKKWTADTKKILKEKFWGLRKFLKQEDLDTVVEILENTGIGYGGKREKALAKSAKRIISNSDEEEFLLLIGRSHAYLNPIYDRKETLASILQKETSINIMTGVILFQNSTLLGGSEGKERITLYELDKKIPWKEFAFELKSKIKENFTLVPLEKELCSLSHYVDYLLIAKNQEPYELLN